VYSISENGMVGLWLQPIDGAPGRQITDYQADGFYRYQYSPDGKTLAALRSHVDSDVVFLRDTTPR